MVLVSLSRAVFRPTPILRSRIETTRSIFTKMAPPTPILAVGAQEAIGQIAIEAMKPEFEVIHFTLRAAVDDEIPLLLRGEVPTPPSSAIGTGNWSVPPRAIIFGGAFTEENVKELKAKVYNGEGNPRKIPWVAVDGSKPRLQLQGNEKNYMADIASRFKKGLAELKEEGKLDSDGADEVKYT